MARKRKQILPFRIPFFRIFYSTTYTIVLIITLCFLAITPGSALLEAIEAGALQYVFIIGGVYILTAIIAIFIYTSRLYTNRVVLAAVGKPYIPIEAGEIGKKIRAAIVAQLKRSAIVSWEGKPRDVKGEIAYAEKEGLLSAQDHDTLGPADTMGTLVPVDVNAPPWGDVQHRGWTAPSEAPSDYPSNLHFDIVLAELPHLLEARAVSLAPADRDTESGENPLPDQSVVEMLRRQQSAGLREYLTQISYLGLVDLHGSGAAFLDMYERARFSGQPPSYVEFKQLMAYFAIVMDRMKAPDPAIVDQIRLQLCPINDIPSLIIPGSSRDYLGTPEPMFDAASGTSIDDITPVTAHTRQATPYLSQGNVSFESFGSVMYDRRAVTPNAEALADTEARSLDSSSLASAAGSVIHHDVAT